MLKILFDKKILKYTILPFLIDLVFWFFIFFIFSDEIIVFFKNIVSFLPFSKSIEDLIANIGGTLFITILYYVLVIATLGIFSSFFIDKIVLRVNEYYNCPIREVGLKDNFKGMMVSIKSFLIYLIVFIFTFYLLFIPIVNIFYQLFMMSILNKKPLIFDSSYLFFEPDEVEKKYGNKIKILVFLTSIIYLIPFISLFGYTFQLVIISSYILKKCKGQ